MKIFRTRHDVRGMCSVGTLFGNADYNAGDTTADSFDLLGSLSGLFGGGGGSGGGAGDSANFGLFQVPISAFNPTATATTSFLPITTQSNTESSPFDVSLNFNQTAGPGGSAASSSIFGSLFGLGGGGGGATGGAGGSNYANFDPSITQIYAPPNYSMPLAGLLSNLGAGAEPYGVMPTTAATPNTFRGMPTGNSLGGGNLAMNMPQAGAMSPSLAPLVGGSLAPNSGAAPLSSQQSSPVAQALSALMPQGSQGQAPPLTGGASMSGGGGGFPFSPNLSAFALPPMEGGQQQQPPSPLVPQQAQLDTGAGPPAPIPAPQRPPLVQGGAEKSPIYSMPKLGRQQELQEHATNAVRDLDDIKNEMEQKIKDADSIGQEDKDEGELAGLNADQAQEDLKKDRYKPAQIGGHRHPFLRALGTVGMAFQPQSTVANYINQDAQRKLEAAKFNAEEQYKAAKLNEDVDKALLSQNRLREQAAKTRADLAKHRAKSEAMTEAMRKIDAVKEGLSAENIGAKNELDNAKTQIEVQKLEEQRKMNNSLISYRKAEIETARANAAAHQQIANADTARVAAEYSPKAMQALIDERMTKAALNREQTKQAASYNILGQLIKEGKISKAQANQYMDNMMGQ